MSNQAPHAEQVSSTWAWWAICLSPTLIGAALFEAMQHGPPLPGSVSTLVLVSIAAVQLVVLPFAGGFTYRIGHEGISVKLGVLRLPIKRLSWAAIDAVGVVAGVEPLSSFRGYGLRSNRAQRLVGYVITAGDAVSVASGGWTYLLVMPDPQDFASRADHWRALADRSQHPRDP